MKTGENPEFGVFFNSLFVLQEPLKSLRAKKAEGPRGGSQRSREVKSVPLELQEDVGDSECGVGMGGSRVRVILDGNEIL